MRGKPGRRGPRPRVDAALAAPAARLPTTAMTWIGLGIVAIGWVVQIGGSALASAPAPAGLVALAQSLILSGFGLAILAALQTGFGALDRFFQSIAQRSAAAAARPPTAPPPAPVVTVSPRPDPNRLTGRGRISDRPYLQFADGSVEVETLLGSRRFDSLEEAREFIGG